MRIPKFIRRLKRQQRDAELTMRDRPRRRKLRPLLPALDEQDAPEWDGGAGVEALREIREIYDAPPSSR